MHEITINNTALRKGTLSHYRRMIKYAKKQDPNEEPDAKKMLSDIGEDWYAKHCPYCQTYYRIGCPSTCPLCNNRISCCGGLWTKMNQALTWAQWIIHAKEIVKFIKKTK